MNTLDLPIMTLEGTPRERGRRYGEMAKPLINALVMQWLEHLGQSSQNKQSAKHNAPEVYLKQFFSETNYLDAIKQWTPHLLDEITGIAEGAEQSFEHILGINLMDEEWAFGLRRGLPKPVTKCTAFGLPQSDDGSSYAGQNMDIPSWVEGYQVLLHILPTESTPEMYLFSIAGCIGLNGLNACGLGITCNTLASLNKNVSGLPVLFIVRALLEQRSIAQAECLLRQLPHASGQNYLLSSNEAIHCFECSRYCITPYVPTDWQGAIFHTNHPLINQDITQDGPEFEPSAATNSETRFNSIARRLGNGASSDALQRIKAALAAHDDPEHPVSRTINSKNTNTTIGYTAGSSIYELGDTPRLHLAAGPPCMTDFKIFEFINTP